VIDPPALPGGFICAHLLTLQIGFAPAIEKIDAACLSTAFAALEAEVSARASQLKRG